MAHELQQRLERVEDRIERIERYVKFLAKMPLLVALSLCNLTEEQERKLKEKIHSAPPERLREVAFELDEIRRGRRVVKNE
ncbi:MAG: hypothetical protein AOA65_0912 [Candidatus Bathyarchaeota archaeon BA1]|nr:MAG: hypothetical protein AOA65_0912 [Candidatus Bathyarchaeota archaeon BA1]